jgi:hypothetical protein
MGAGEGASGGVWFGPGRKNHRQSSSTSSEITPSTAIPTNSSTTSGARITVLRVRRIGRGFQPLTDAAQDLQGFGRAAERPLQLTPIFGGQGGEVPVAKSMRFGS